MRYKLFDDSSYFKSARADLKGVVFLIGAVAILLLAVTTVSAYPILIYEKGLNVSLLKNITYSIPENYFTGVDLIYFHNSEYRVKSFDGWQSYSYVKGRYDADVKYRNSTRFRTEILRAVIHIYAPQTFYLDTRYAIEHELIHHKCYIFGVSLSDISSCNYEADNEN